jgi:nucleoside-diphosphate-sugar epimerase
MGASIFEVTYEYDMMVLEYQKNNPETKYIFLSSGAVYGGGFDTPVDDETSASISINHLNETDWYAIAKLYAEARHRALTDLSIIDIRVFNYFSHTQNLDSRFLITDIVRAIQEGKQFTTSSDDIVRDYITPPDFFNLIQSIIDFKPVNQAVDCYTKSPVGKLLMLSELESKFGLQYVVSESHDSLNATGAKINYYSLNNALSDFGYSPVKSSLEGLVDEITLIDSNGSP